MTRPDLVLTGAVEGLVTRGSPLWWRDEETPYVALTGAWMDDRDGGMFLNACPCAGIPLGVMDHPSNFTLDLTHPLGLATALYYLRERGHDGSRFAAHLDALAWCVLSVSRGGGLLRGMITGIAYMDGVGCALLEGGGTVGGTVRRDRHWYARLPGGEKSGPFDSMNASEDAFEVAALAAGYAVFITDDTLNLPLLPEVPHAD